MFDSIQTPLQEAPDLLGNRKFGTGQERRMLKRLDVTWCLLASAIGRKIAPEGTLLESENNAETVNDRAKLMMHRIAVCAIRRRPELVEKIRVHHSSFDRSGLVPHGFPNGTKF